MKYTNTVFYQLLRFISKHRFDGAVNRHQGDSPRSSIELLESVYRHALCSIIRLPILESTFNNHSNHHYYLGVCGIRHSTLADANKKRPVKIFKELFYSLLCQVRQETAKEAQQAIRLIDSTTIDLHKQNFSWAHFRSRKASIKLHFIYDPEQEAPSFFL